MRIYDNESDRTLGSVDLFLSHDDIDELMSVLESLKNGHVGGHQRAMEREPALREYVREINLVLYEEGSVPTGWSERAAEIVLEDE